MRSKPQVAIPLAVLCALVLGLTYGRVTWAQQGTSPTPPNHALLQSSYTIYLPLVSKQPTPVPSTFADRVIELVNQERTMYGCPALVKNTALTNAAQGHSTDMALNDFVSHTGSDGSSPATRATGAGYNWAALAE
ncbi:MAG: CAP domain-containing protein, partial [Chloroflexota bacterium]